MTLRLLRRTLPFTAAAAVLYLCYVAVVRYDSDRTMERRIRARELKRDALPAEESGTAVRIAQFYANAGEITRGSHAVICYSVRNARAVRLDPEVESLKPALNRCFSVSPRATTTYTLHAEGFDGSETAASFTVNVGPPPPRILFVNLSSTDMKRGTAWAMCYGVADTVKAVFEPLGTVLPVSRKHCMQTYLMRSAKYSLVAYGEDGKTDREQFQVTVR